MASIESKWRCEECLDVHDYPDEALECCPPRITEVYMCPICEETHGQEANAIDCCGFELDAPPPPTSALEMEAAGQIRLLA